MLVHFICTGNVYRSRLAETYLRSLELPSFTTMSSGIEAALNLNGPISWYAQRIIQNERLVRFETPYWQQTTRALIEQGDVTIFMHRGHHEYCVSALGFDSPDYEVWNILDLNEFDFSAVQDADEFELARIRATEATYMDIQAKIHEFIKKH